MILEIAIPIICGFLSGWIYCRVARRLQLQRPLCLGTEDEDGMITISCHGGIRPQMVGRVYIVDGIGADFEHKGYSTQWIRLEPVPTIYTIPENSLSSTPQSQ